MPAPRPSGGSGVTSTTRPSRSWWSGGRSGCSPGGWIWAAFFVGAGGALRRLQRGQTRERTLIVGSIAAIAGFLVAGLFEYNFGDSEVVMVAYVVMALAFAASRQEATPLA